MAEELTKAGTPVSERTFGTLVGKDDLCRHAAIDLEMDDSDLRLFGRYMHFHGYRSLEESRDFLKGCVKNNSEPFLSLEPKKGKVVDFQEWKNQNT